MSDLKKFEEKRKTNLADTIGNTFRMGIEDLSRTISGTKKPTAKGERLAKNQISSELDTYENGRINKHRKQA
ncbi:MAG: hypothetical protein WCJ45_01925 [bacterium]